MATTAELQKINDAVRAGTAKTVGGVEIKEPLDEALLADGAGANGGSLVYPVREGIPILLIQEGHTAMSKTGKLAGELPEPMESEVQPKHESDKFTFDFFRRYQKAILYTAGIFALVTFSITGAMTQAVGTWFSPSVAMPTMKLADGTELHVTAEDYDIANFLQNWESYRVAHDALDHRRRGAAQPREGHLRGAAPARDPRRHRGLAGRSRPRDRAVDERSRRPRARRPSTPTARVA
jgi:hypothetical protein